MASAPRMKSPVIRLGGKTRLLPVLLSVMERMAPHVCYCEPFCGGAVLLFAKRPSETEIISDVDRAVYDFFSVMRDPVQAAELKRRLVYTPWSRDELLACDANWRLTADRVERVRQWFAISRMSFTHEIESPSWWAAKAENQAMRFASSVDLLDLVAQRLRRVQVDNRSFEHCLKLYDSANTLFYVDPPYVQSARVDGKYEHELSDAQHAQLLDLVLACKGQVILSGYHTPLYDERLAHLPLVEKTRECTIHNSREHKKSYRTECVWIKAHPFGLFSALDAADEEGIAEFAAALSVNQEVSADEEAADAVEQGEARTSEGEVEQGEARTQLRN